MGTMMQPEVKNRIVFRVLFPSYCVGTMVCLLTQLIVLAEQGPRIYASPLWGILYPARLFIDERITRIGYAVHAPIKSTTVTGIGIAVTSAIFGLIVPILVGLTQLGNRVGRYVGLALIVIFVLFALFWDVLPNVF
jgi:hypothetical protein